MKFDFDIRGKEVQVVAIATAGLVVTTITSQLIGYFKQLSESKRLLAMPDSYWEAEARKAEADIHSKDLEFSLREQEIASRERLEIDSRDRSAARQAARLEFERSAPPEYWDAMARKAEAEERGKTDRENARRQSDAIVKAAAEIRRAVE